MIKYRKGNLFDAPTGTYLAHACNCKGVWSSGVAAQFAEKFPKSYEEYKIACKYGSHPGDVLVCSEENGYRVVCLFTSNGYAHSLDPKEKIIDATKQTLAVIPRNKPIHMPKINSGLFRVPWESTAILFAEHDDLDVTVWEL